MTVVLAVSPFLRFDLGWHTFLPSYLAAAGGYLGGALAAAPAKGARPMVASLQRALGSVSVSDLFLVVSAATLSIYAVELAGTSGSPLFTTVRYDISGSIYALTVLGAVMAGWLRWRPLGGAVAALVLLTVAFSPFYLEVLQPVAPTNIHLHFALLVGAAVLAAGEVGRPTKATRRLILAGALFLASGLVSTWLAADPSSSLITLQRTALFLGASVLAFYVVERGAPARPLLLALLAVSLIVSATTLQTLARVARETDLESAIRYKVKYQGLIGAGGNDLGVWPAAGLVLLVGLKRPPLPRVAAVALEAAALVAAVGMLAALVANFSLSAMQGAVLGLLILLVLGAVVRSLSREQLLRLAMIGVAAAAWGAVVLSHGYLEEFRDRGYTTGGRMVIWRMVAEDIAANPVFGIGLNNHESRAAQVEDLPKNDLTVARPRPWLVTERPTWKGRVITHAHNVVLEVTESQGFVGLAAGLALVGVLVTPLFALPGREAGERALALAALGVAAAGVSRSMAALGAEGYLLPAPVWFAMPVAAGLAARAPPGGRAASGRAWRGRRWLLASAVALVYLALVAWPAASDTALAAARFGTWWAEEDDSDRYYRVAALLQPWDSEIATQRSSLHLRGGDYEKALEQAQKAVDQAEGPRQLTTLGWLLWLQEGDAEGALEAFTEADQLDPWDTGGRNPQLAAALASVCLGRPEEARQWLQRSALLNPEVTSNPAITVVYTAEGPVWSIDPAFTGCDDGPNPARTGRILQQLGIGFGSIAKAAPAAPSAPALDVVEALDAAWESLAPWPRNQAFAYISLAENYEALGLAEVAAERLLRLPPEVRELPEVRYRTALMLEAAEEPRAEEAFRALARQLAAGESYEVITPFAYYEAGNLAAGLGDPATALADFRAADRQTRWERLPGLQLGLAAALNQLGLDGQAESAWSAEIYWQDSAEARMGRALTRYRLGDAKGSRSDLLRVVELVGLLPAGDVDSALLAAFLLAQAGDADFVSFAVQEILREVEDEALRASFQARLLQLSGSPVEADEAYHRAIGAAGSEDATFDVQFAYFTFLWSQGENAAAAALGDSLLERQELAAERGTLYPLLTLQAGLLLRLQRPQEAEQLLVEAVEVRPFFRDAFALLAQAALAEGDTDRAVGYLYEALARDRICLGDRESLADLLEQTGEAEMAQTVREFAPTIRCP